MTGEIPKGLLLGVIGFRRPSLYTEPILADVVGVLRELEPSHALCMDMTPALILKVAGVPYTLVLTDPDVGCDRYPGDGDTFEEVVSSAHRVLYRKGTKPTRWSSARFDVMQYLENQSEAMIAFRLDTIRDSPSFYMCRNASEHGIPVKEIIYRGGNSYDTDYRYEEGFSTSGDWA